MSEALNLDGMLSSRRDITRFKVTEGSHIFRILPPFGTNHNNVPSRKIELHWGFTKKDGGLSPVLCSYPTEGFCPICAKVKELESLAATLLAQGNKEMADAALLLTQMDQAGADALRAQAQGNLDKSDATLKDAGRIKARRSYLLNAANKNGELGILEITKTAVDALVCLMKQYVNRYGKNPTSLTQGCWFVFNRTGKGYNTVYTVEFNKKMLTLDDGEQVEKVDTEALSPNIITNFDKLAYDIHKMYIPVSAVDLQKILAGAPVDEVIVKKPKEQAPAPVAAPVAVAPAAKPAVTLIIPASKPEVKVAAPKPVLAAPAPAVVPEADDLDDIMSILDG